MTDTEVMVVGGGLAGAEAAWQLARAGLRVCLLEMRPVRRTPVHTGDRLAELVCSNSLRGDAPSNAVGLLKQEMARLDSLVIGSARAAAVPAGGALAVDREGFAASVTEAITRKDEPRAPAGHVSGDAGAARRQRPARGQGSIRGGEFEALVRRFAKPLIRGFLSRA